MTLSMTGVSVVVLTKNSELTVGKCLDALAALSSLLESVVVVDGGSTDSTLNIVASFKDRLPLKILSDNGCGLGYARDVGWRATNSLFVVMLDSDVVIVPRFVEEAVKLMNNDERIAALAAKLKPVIEDKSWLARFQEKKLDSFLHLNEPCYPVEAVAVHTACTVFRRQALSDVKGFDAFFKFAKEDSDICFRLRKAGFGVYYLPIEVLHLERPRFWKINFRYGRSYVHIAEKHPDTSPIFTFKNIAFVLAFFVPPLQLLIFLHYMRRYLVMPGLSFSEKAFLPFIETVRQAVRTAGMLYELVRESIRFRPVSG